MMYQGNEQVCSIEFRFDRQDLPVISDQSVNMIKIPSFILGMDKEVQMADEIIKKEDLKEGI